MTVRYSDFCLATAVQGIVATACGIATANLRRRASFDLDCPEDDLEIVSLGAQTKGVRGCGRQGTYVLMGTPGGRAWVLNSEAGGEANGDGR